MAEIDYKKQLSGLKNLEQNLLKNVKGAGLGESTPTLSDVNTQQRLLQTRGQIEALQNKQLAERWYGKSEDKIPEGIEEKPSLFFRTLDKLARPLYAVAGAVDYATGGSKETSLFKAVGKNISEEKKTFGTILREKGTPKVVSAPLGFMLDIAFDPVNWATLGTAALVPRTAAGFIGGVKKGGLALGAKTAVKGAGSRLAESALTTRGAYRWMTGKLAPSVSRKAEMTSTSATANELGKIGRFSKNLDEKSLRWADEYNDVLGRNIVRGAKEAGRLPVNFKELKAVDSKKIASEGISDFRLKAGDLIREVSERIPFVNKYFKYFDYNNAEWTRLVKVKEALMKSVGTEEETKKAIKSYIKSIEDGIPFEEALEKAIQEADLPGRLAKVEPSPMIEWDAADEILPSGKIKESKLLDDLKDTDDIMQNPQKYITFDGVENSIRLAEEETGARIGIADLKDIIGRGELGETGWKWWDDLRKKAISSEKEIKFGKHSQKVGEIMVKSMDAFSKYMNIFKRGAVGASPTAWVNAIIGNPVMAWMSGVNILDPVFLKRVNEARSIRFGKAGPVLLEDFFAIKEVAESLERNPKLFELTTGLSTQQLKGKYALENMMRIGQEQGILGKETAMEDLAKALGYAADESYKEAIHQFTGVSAESKNLASLAKAVEKKRLAKIGERYRESARKGEKLVNLEKATDFLSAETFNDDATTKMFANWETKAREGNKIYKLLDTVYNKLPDVYGGIDQTYKLGVVKYAVLDGFTEKELKTIVRTINISPSDLSKVSSEGVWRYRMSMPKSLELANEIFLNYAAMPAAIRILRNFPLLGSPFAAFTYGMTLKTAKSALYNPSVFNKVQFGLNEFGGEKSPLEKAVLSSGRYSYLNQPGMVKISGLSKIPFFQTNTIYLNMENMIPFYSLNMFENIERKYENRYSNAVIGTIDKSPFMKDPAGQTIFDYFVQPLILKTVGDETRPVHAFGQPFLPIDATKTEKVGYFSRSLADPLVPGVVSLAGLPVGAIAPDTTNYIPSYKFRRLANAVQGKSPIGVKGKEPAVSRSVRGILGTFGIPVQSPVPLSYLPQDTVKELKKIKK